MTFTLRSELMDELNMLKRVLKEAEKEGEVIHSERKKIMDNIGQIKSILYANAIFKGIYTSSELRKDKMVVNK